LLTGGIYGVSFQLAKIAADDWQAGWYQKAGIHLASQYVMRISHGLPTATRRRQEPMKFAYNKHLSRSVKSHAAALAHVYKDWIQAPNRD
jgi:hypothetical protein